MGDQTRIIQESIKLVQQRYMYWANRRRSERMFEVGDMVFIRVKPEHSIVTFGKHKKLNPLYCGSFKIIRKVENLAYKLELPPSIQVHDIFHVNL